MTNGFSSNSVFTRTQPQSISPQRSSSLKTSSGGSKKTSPFEDRVNKITNPTSQNPGSIPKTSPSSQQSIRTEIDKLIDEQKAAENAQRKQFEDKQKAQREIAIKQAQTKAAQDFAKLSAIEQYRKLKDAGYTGTYKEYSQGGVAINFESKIVERQPTKIKNNTVLFPGPVLFEALVKKEDMKTGKSQSPLIVKRSVLENVFVDGFDLLGSAVPGKYDKMIEQEKKDASVKLFGTSKPKPNEVSKFEPKNKIDYEIGKQLESSEQLTRAKASVFDFGLGIVSAFKGVGMSTYGLFTGETITGAVTLAEKVFTDNQFRIDTGKNILDRPAKFTGQIIGSLYLVPKTIGFVKNLFVDKVVYDAKVPLQKKYKYSQGVEVIRTGEGTLYNPQIKITSKPIKDAIKISNTDTIIFQDAKTATQFIGQNQANLKFNQVSGMTGREFKAAITKASYVPEGATDKILYKSNIKVLEVNKPEVVISSTGDVIIKRPVPKINYDAAFEIVKREVPDIALQDTYRTTKSLIKTNPYGYESVTIVKQSPFNWLMDKVKTVFPELTKNLNRPLSAKSTENFITTKDFSLIEKRLNILNKNNLVTGQTTSKIVSVASDSVIDLNAAKTNFEAIQKTLPEIPNARSSFVPPITAAAIYSTSDVEYMVSSAVLKNNMDYKNSTIKREDLTLKPLAQTQLSNQEQNFKTDYFSINTKIFNITSSGVQKQKQYLAMDVLQKQDIKLDVTQKQDIKLDVTQKQVPKFFKIPLNPTPTYTPNYKPPQTPIFFGSGTTKGKSTIFNLVDGFDVFVRRNNKFERINTSPLTKSKALMVGQDKVSNSIAATFKLVKSPIKVSESKTPFDLYKLNKQFTLKKKEGQDLFIEKNKYRISTFGEKRDLKQAKKNRGLYGWK